MTAPAARPVRPAARASDRAGIIPTVTGGIDRRQGRRWIPLAALLVPGRPLHPPDVARIGADVAAALADRHAAGRVHGRIDAAHVVLGNVDAVSPGVEVAGVEVAGVEVAGVAVAGEGPAGPDGGAAGHPFSGTVVLLDPVAPSPPSLTSEFDEPPTPARDVRDLGAVLATALTGRPVEPGSTAAPDDVGSAWRQLLRSMTAASPADRPSAAWVRDALAEPARRATVVPAVESSAPPGSTGEDPPAAAAPRSKLLPAGEKIAPVEVDLPTRGRWARLVRAHRRRPDRDMRDRQLPD